MASLYTRTREKLFLRIVVICDAQTNIDCDFIIMMCFIGFERFVHSAPDSLLQFHYLDEWKKLSSVWTMKFQFLGVHSLHW